MPDQLQLQPATDRRDLLAEPVAAAIDALPGAGQVQVAEIDPGAADTAEFCARYGVGLDESANCVVVAGRRSGETRRRWHAPPSSTSTSTAPHRAGPR